MAPLLVDAGRPEWQSFQKWYMLYSFYSPCSPNKLNESYIHEEHCKIEQIIANMCEEHFKIEQIIAYRCGEHCKMKVGK